MVGLNAQGRKMTPDSKNTLHDALDWRLFGVLFECPSDELREEIPMVSRKTTDSLLRETAKTAPKDASISQYYKVLGPGGPVAPRDVSYRKRILPGQLLGELIVCYEAFGYAPKECKHLPTQSVNTEISDT